MVSTLALTAPSLTLRANSRHVAAALATSMMGSMPSTTSFTSSGKSPQLVVG